MTHLSIKNLEKSYGSFKALKGVSLEIQSGEFVVLVGPSGCGKSTLLRSIAGLEGVTSGSIHSNETDITHAQPDKRGVAMVFQNYALYPHMSVAENMGFALRTAGLPKDQVTAAVNKAAETLRISQHLHKKPKQLSGGQKQRVAIGRAITRSPDVFLFDEPLSNLDAELRTQMRIELGKLHDELKATMIYVTHDQVEAMTMADRIVVIDGGQIKQSGAPLELYNAPTSRLVAGFLGAPKMNFFDLEVVDAHSGHVTVKGPVFPDGTTLKLKEGVSEPLKGAKVTAGIRPEAVQISDGGLKATVAVQESLGRDTLIFASAPHALTNGSDSAEGYWAIHLAQQNTLEVGREISLKIDPTFVHLFDEDGDVLLNGSAVGAAV